MAALAAAPLPPPPAAAPAARRAEPEGEEEEKGGGEARRRPPTLIPPLSFSPVAPGVFRSAYPTPKSFPFLQRRGLRSILCLSPDDPYSGDNAAFVESSGIRLFYVDIIGNKEPFVGIPEEAMTQALRLILDVRNHPMLVHCRKGQHLTGCVLGCLRKLQRWSLTSILDEYCRFAGTNMRVLDQQFIELFPAELEFNKAYAPGWI